MMATQTTLWEFCTEVAGATGGRQVKGRQTWCFQKVKKIKLLVRNHLYHI